MVKHDKSEEEKAHRVQPGDNKPPITSDFWLREEKLSSPKDEPSSWLSNTK